jgi:uncharacterized membrane protein YgcG
MKRKHWWSLKKTECRNRDCKNSSWYIEWPRTTQAIEDESTCSGECSCCHRHEEDNTTDVINTLITGIIIEDTVNSMELDNFNSNDSCNMDCGSCNGDFESGGGDFGGGGADSSW